jgi:hypothetical protein
MSDEFVSVKNALLATSFLLVLNYLRTYGGKKIAKLASKKSIVKKASVRKDNKRLEDCAPNDIEVSCDHLFIMRPGNVVTPVNQTASQPNALCSGKPISECIDSRKILATAAAAPAAATPATAAPAAAAPAAATVGDTMVSV